MADPNNWSQAMFDSAPPKLEGMELETLEAFYHYFSEVDEQLAAKSNLRLNTERMALLRSVIELKRIEKGNQERDAVTAHRHRETTGIGSETLLWTKRGAKAAIIAAIAAGLGLLLDMPLSKLLHAITSLSSQSSSPQMTATASLSPRPTPQIQPSQTSPVSATATATATPIKFPPPAP